MRKAEQRGHSADGNKPILPAPEIAWLPRGLPRGLPLWAADSRLKILGSLQAPGSMRLAALPTRPQGRWGGAALHSAFILGKMPLCGKWGPGREGRVALASQMPAFLCPAIHEASALARSAQAPLHQLRGTVPWAGKREGRGHKSLSEAAAKAGKCNLKRGGTDFVVVWSLFCAYGHTMGKTPEPV